MLWKKFPPNLVAYKNIHYLTVSLGQVRSGLAEGLSWGCSPRLTGLAVGAVGPPFPSTWPVILQDPSSSCGFPRKTVWTFYMVVGLCEKQRERDSMPERESL